MNGDGKRQELINGIEAEKDPSTRSQRKKFISMEHKNAHHKKSWEIIECSSVRHFFTMRLKSTAILMSCARLINVYEELLILEEIMKNSFTHSFMNSIVFVNRNDYAIILRIGKEAQRK